jgi:hypothetical protein
MPVILTQGRAARADFDIALPPVAEKTIRVRFPLSLGPPFA